MAEENFLRQMLGKLGQLNDVAPPDPRSNPTSFGYLMRMSREIPEKIEEEEKKKAFEESLAKLMFGSEQTINSPETITWNSGAQRNLGGGKIGYGPETTQYMDQRTVRTPGIAPNIPGLEAVARSNPAFMSQIAQSALEQRMKGAEPTEFKPVPGAPGMFYDPRDPSKIITSQEAQRLAREMKLLGRPTTNVNLNTPRAETEYQKGLGKDFAELRAEISEEGAQATSELRTIQNARSLLGQADVGPFAVTAANAQIVANRLGIPLDTTQATATQALASVLAQSAIQDLQNFPGRS
jgi:hypothetical protein